MRAALVAVTALALSGCARPPAAPPYLQPPPKPTPLNTAGEEDKSRTRARVHTELAAGYFELRNMAVALEEVNAALKADDRYAPAHNVAALIHAELRQDDLAQDHFQRALRLDPRDPDINNNYGRYLCERKREAEALRFFDAALKNPLYRTPERSYVNAGLCSLRQGNVGVAEEYFLQALKVSPLQPQALYQLSEIAYARGDFARAKDFLVRLEQVTQPSAEVLWLALRIERRLGDRDAVASYGQQLRRQFPDSKEARALTAGRYE